MQYNQKTEQGANFVTNSLPVQFFDLILCSVVSDDIFPDTKDIRR